MAVGDLKGPECITIKVAAGAAVARGDLVHIEADGYWDKTAAGDIGKFGMALDPAAAEGDIIRVCVYGPCEVKASNAAIAKGELVVADAGMVKKAGTLDATSIVGLLVGTAMDTFAANGNGVVWIGLVG